MGDGEIEKRFLLITWEGLAIYFVEYWQQKKQKFELLNTVDS